MRLGQVVMRKVAVVKLGVDNGSGDGGGCFGIKVWTDTAKLMKISSEKVRCSSNMKSRFRAE